MAENEVITNADDEAVFAELRRLRALMGNLTAEQLLTVIIASGPAHDKDEGRASSFLTGLDSGLAIGLHHPRLAEAMVNAMRAAVSTIDRHKGNPESVHKAWNRDEERWVSLLNIAFGIEERVS